MKAKRKCKGSGCSGKNCPPAKARRKPRVWPRWAVESGQFLHVFTTHSAAEEWSNMSATPFRVEVREVLTPRRKR